MPEPGSYLATNGPRATDFKALVGINVDPKKTDFIIYVGPEEIAINGHRAVLARNSGYFRRMCFNKRLKECEQGFVRMPEKDPQIFKEAHRFLYTGRWNPKNASRRKCILLLELSHYLEMPSLKKMVWDNYIRTFTPFLILGNTMVWNETLALDAIVELFVNRKILDAAQVEELMTLICDFGWTDVLAADERVMKILEEDSALTVKLVQCQAKKLRELHDRAEEFGTWHNGNTGVITWNP